MGLPRAAGAWGPRQGSGHWDGALMFRPPLRQRASFARIRSAAHTLRPRALVPRSDAEAPSPWGGAGTVRLSLWGAGWPRTLVCGRPPLRRAGEPWGPVAWEGRKGTLRTRSVCVSRGVCDTRPVGSGRRRVGSPGWSSRRKRLRNEREFRSSHRTTLRSACPRRASRCPMSGGLPRSVFCR